MAESLCTRAVQRCFEQVSACESEAMNGIISYVNYNTTSIGTPSPLRSVCFGLFLIFAPRDGSLQTFAPNWVPVAMGTLATITAPLSMSAYIDNSVRPYKLFSKIKKDLRNGQKLYVASSKFRSTQELWHFLDLKDIKLYLFGLAVDEHLKGKVFAIVSFLLSLFMVFIIETRGDEMFK